jgi:hypothetical protein
LLKITVSNAVEAAIAAIIFVDALAQPFVYGEESPPLSDT